MLFPFVVTVVATLFAGSLWRQFWNRRRPYHLVWALSLSAGAIAGLAFLLFLTLDRNAVFFKLYYISGAVLMAALLGLGSVYLLAPRRIADNVAWTVAAASIIASLMVLSASVNSVALHQTNIEAGTKLITGPSVVFIAALNTFGALAVVGGAVYSGWRLRRRKGPGRMLAANVLIALGTILASLAGTLARISGSGSAFWLLLTGGMVVLFVGFTFTTLPLDRAGAPQTTPGVSHQQV